MKTLFMAMALLLSFVLTTPVVAQPKPMANLNVSQIVKATEVIKKYRALVKNPESLKAIMRLAESIKNKKANK